MQFSHKLKKLGRRSTYASARRCIERFFRSRDRKFPLTVPYFRSRMENPEFLRVRELYAVDYPTQDHPKYFETERWLATNIQRVRELGLDIGKRRRILDLGCGSGYFLFINRELGHDVLGVDFDAVPMYREVIDALGLKRVDWEIRPFVPLPELGAKFDLITAFLICFNGHKEATLWGPREWGFFLDDAARHLVRGGRLLLELNREHDDTYYTPELERFFRERGARIDRPGRVLFTMNSKAQLAK